MEGGSEWCFNALIGIARSKCALGHHRICFGLLLVASLFWAGFEAWALVLRWHIRKGMIPEYWSILKAHDSDLCSQLMAL